jgi:uncharacterized protein
MQIRVAAAGDIHCAEEERARLRAAFAEADRSADLILLAGDLTTYGEPEQAEVLADVGREVETPIFAVLGNHDWHADRRDEVVDTLQAGNVRVLERDATTAQRSASSAPRASSVASRMLTCPTSESRSSVACTQRRARR